VQGPVLSFATLFEASTSAAADEENELEPSTKKVRLVVPLRRRSDIQVRALRTYRDTAAAIATDSNSIVPKLSDWTEEELLGLIILAEQNETKRRAEAKKLRALAPHLTQASQLDRDAYARAAQRKDGTAADELPDIDISRDQDVRHSISSLDMEVLVDAELEDLSSNIRRILVLDDDFEFSETELQLQKQGFFGSGLPAHAPTVSVPSAAIASSVASSDHDTILSPSTAPSAATATTATDDHDAIATNDPMTLLLLYDPVVPQAR
jgi:hypothetical protein